MSIEWRFARSSTAHGDTPSEVHYYTRCFPQTGGAESLGNIIDAVKPRRWRVLAPRVTSALSPADHRFWHAETPWTILDDQLRDEPTILQAALTILQVGDEHFKWPFPIARFGRLLAIERSETENLRALETLIQNYMTANPVQSPLSIAVFGSPGNGKSFAIKALAAGLSSERALSDLTFNLSQFSSPDAITNSLHQVRDVALSGKMPLVFWDEFDSAYEAQPLGWLRFFLAPMQDGTFLEDAFTHNIGKAIFVFAGGTFDTKKDFMHAVEADKKEKKAKAEDFLSRLRGYLEIPDLNHSDGRLSAAVTLRRAVRLRRLLAESAGNLVQQYAGRGDELREELNADENVLRACLTIPKYNHGARSIEAIVKMSALSKRMRYGPSSLPPEGQLGLHVDAEVFLALLRGPSAGTV